MAICVHMVPCSFHHHNNHVFSASTISDKKDDDISQIHIAENGLEFRLHPTLAPRPIDETQSTNMFLPSI